LMLDYHMLVFVTVTEKKNFSRAAEALNLSQPAISLQIQALEEYYGTKLFERSNKRVELTQAGEALYPTAVQILELYQAGKQAVSDLVGSVSGRLVIGASLTIGEYVLPRILARFSEQFPQVDVSLRVANTEIVAEQSMAGLIDLGLVEGPMTNNRLRVIPFAEDEMTLIVPPKHRLAIKPVADVKDLASETFILRESGSGTRHAMEEQLRQISVHPRKIIELGSTGAIKEAVEAGLGISFVSRWSIRKELRLQSLVSLRVRDHVLLRSFSIILLESRFHSRAMKEFIRIVEDVKEPTTMPENE